METIRLAFASGPINPDVPQFNPDEGLSAIRAWCKWQEYDHRDKLVQTVDHWGLLKLAEPLEFTNKTLTEVSYQLRGISAALNSGT